LDVGLDPNGPTGGPIVYWDTDDIAASLTQLKAEGAAEMVATVADAAGNVVGLRQNL
jgi:hypothetical protein